MLQPSPARRAGVRTGVAAVAITMWMASASWAQILEPVAAGSAAAADASAGAPAAAPAGAALVQAMIEPPPMTGRERARWAVESSVGPKSLAAGVISAAWGVARDRPDEYGPNWRGFGKRYALRLSGVSIGNALEAGVGAIWDEDPRYRRAGSGPLWGRIGRAGKWTVLASRPDGTLRPAYARGIGIVTNNFMTNAWRVDSDSSVADALSRSGVGVTSRFVSNLFDEFWPDIQRRVLRR